MPPERPEFISVRPVLGSVLVIVPNKFIVAPEKRYVVFKLSSKLLAMEFLDAFARI